MERIQDVLSRIAPDAGQAPGMARAAQMLAQPGALAGGAQAAGRPDFSNMLTDAIQSVQQAQGEAAAMQKAYQQGAPDAGLEETMISMNKASLSFQMLAQARNRVVAAYSDIMNMQV